MMDGLDGECLSAQEFLEEGLGKVCPDLGRDVLNAWRNGATLMLSIPKSAARISLESIFPKPSSSLARSAVLAIN